ncbi:MAG: polyprenyl diphosphate synthase [Oscillospiraceae bacterium]|nr:polyprenyl diphosphate synthase [Oscillospiraceae bacterium]
MQSERLPKHIGVIMDGNRRWAKKRLLPVVAGHKKGAEVLRERVIDLAKRGVANATFYALSTENLNRSADEVENLMRLFDVKLDELARITDDEDIRLAFIGDLSVFPEKLQSRMDEAARKSCRNAGLVCRIALNYGGKAEIVRAARNLAMRGDGSAFTESAFAAQLYTADAPDVDLIIRTGGEKRLSNFLLWQAAYAELYFTDTLWCDFDSGELDKALSEYAKRERRIGK